MKKRGVYILFKIKYENLYKNSIDLPIKDPHYFIYLLFAYLELWMLIENRIERSI